MTRERIRPPVARRAGADRSAPSAGLARATRGRFRRGAPPPSEGKYEEATTALARFEAKLEQVEGRGGQETLPGVGS